MKELIYKKHGDYLLPDLDLTKAEQQPLGKYGVMRMHYLEQHRPGLFTRLILSGKLMEHLQEIELSAQNRFDLLMKLLVKQNNVTEELKSHDQMTWVGMMNNLKTRRRKQSLLS